MSNSSVALTSTIVKYYGPDFTRTNLRIRQIQQQRTENLDNVCAGDAAFNADLVDKSGQPLTVAEVDNRANTDPNFERALTNRIANQGESRTIDLATFKMEAKEISALLERYTDADIDALRKFLLDTLAKEDSQFLEKLSVDDVNGIREILSLVTHLAYNVAPITIKEDFSPDARAKYTRLDPRKLMTKFLSE